MIWVYWSISTEQYLHAIKMPYSTNVCLYYILALLFTFLFCAWLLLLILLLHSWQLSPFLETNILFRTILHPLVMFHCLEKWFSKK